MTVGDTEIHTHLDVCQPAFTSRCCAAIEISRSANTTVRS